VKWFDYAAPGTTGEALALLSAEGANARALAGGTDLLVQMRSGRVAPGLVVDVKRIPDLNELTYTPGAGLTLGAAVPCFRVYRDAAVCRRYPALAGVARLIGGVQIQGRASIGGNLCNASPSADSIPLLIALRAVCRVEGPQGTREIPVENFCTAPGRSVLEKDELLVSLRFPEPVPGSGAHYLRFTPRNEMDIAVAGAGVSVVIAGGRIQSIHMALSAVAPTPLYVAGTAGALAGRYPDEDALRTAAELARAAAMPITDMRGTADYRLHLCGVLARRAFQAALQGARENGHHA
jgi:CO/xanthine dehydrogenase FAD-binding subunit